MINVIPMLMNFQAAELWENAYINILGIMNYFYLNEICDITVIHKIKINTVAYCQDIVVYV